MEVEESVQRTLRLQRVLSNFIKHVEDLRNEDDHGCDGFNRDFKSLRDLAMTMRDRNTYPTEEGMKSYNAKKNRYKDILPFDATRVVLEKIPGEQDSDYINANFIKDQYQNMSYIATQGPVQSSVYDFWRMIVQYKVKVITMACKLVEMGRKKCEQYWPSEVNETVEYKDISVTMTEEKIIDDHYTKRFLSITKGGDAFTVTQFHYTGWPDHDIPNDFDVILGMMYEMREIKAADVDKAPMVIHCSAGCGRTGTICAIDYAWDILNTGNMTDDFSLFEIIKEMRTQRQSMIQAPEQYMMAHITVQTLFKKHLAMMKDHIYGNIDDQTDRSDEITGDVSDSSDKQQPQKNSSLQNKSEQTLKSTTSISNIHKRSEHHALLPQQELKPVTDFNAENIESIPKSNKMDPVLIDESDMQNRTSNNILSDGDRKDLRVETELCHNSIPLLESKNVFRLDIGKSDEPVEQYNIASQSSINSHKPNFQQVQSQQDQCSGKFRTVISVEKQQVSKSLSNTVETMAYESQSTPVELLKNVQRNSASESLLANCNKNSSDIRLSSVSAMLPEQSSDTCSAASNRRQYSSLCDTSSRESTHYVHLDPSAASASFNENNHAKSQNENSYSVPDYSSVNKATKYSNSLLEFDPYSTVASDVTSPVDPYSTVASDIATPFDPCSTVGSNIATSFDPYSTIGSDIAIPFDPYSTVGSDIATHFDPHGFVDSYIPTLVDHQKVISLSDDDVGYSIASDPGYLNGHPDGLYSQVNRPKDSSSKPAASDYEAIAFGDKRAPPPPIPARHYEDPSVDKTGSSGSFVPLKKPHGGSVIKNLFNPSKVTNGPSTTEPLLLPLIADLGFKNRLGKKPGGQKPQPLKWQKK